MPPKAQCLNPVFTGWLEEMRDELDPESNYWKVYNRAVKSMRAHPKYLEHPRECAEVKYVGPRIRDQLVKKYESENGATQAGSQSVHPKTSAHRSSDDEVAVAISQQNQVGKACPPSPEIPSAIKGTKQVRTRAPVTRSIPPTSIGTLSSSESEPPTLKIKLSSQLHKTDSSTRRTPKAPKRTKSAPVRPRLSAMIPAPPAASDIEPESDASSKSATGEAEMAALFPSFEPLVFPTGSYTIQLVLDEREVKSTKDRDYMLNGLKKRGVNVTKRSLEIGDMCWIARYDAAGDESCAECVLDYIVERKRMDDLKGSILDGRFHEQKFRLKHTGISHVYYLVEDYNTERIASQWKEQINTALSSTQVVDRFFLKETISIEDTLDYLSGLHKTIVKLYSGKPLHIIPPPLVKRYNFLALKQHLAATHPEKFYHTTYSSYQELNRKNSFYTLKDCMARMLQCIRGLSEEKIAELIEHYPTPRSLYEAFVEAEAKFAMSVGDTQSHVEPGDKKGKKKAKAPSAELPELLLTEMGGGGRRKIGPALSKHIYEIFMDHSYKS